MSEFMRAGSTPWLATPLLAAATLVALSVLQYNIVFADWVITSAVVFAVVVVAIVITRIASRNRFLPTLIGAVAGLLVIVPTYARGADGKTFILPTPEALGALASTFRGGVTYAVETTSPAPAENGLVALVTTVFLALFLISEFIAVSWRHTATAGMILLLPWVYPIASSTRVSEVAIVVALALWIGAMALTPPDNHGRRRQNFGSGLLATAAAVGVMLIAVPTALTGTGWGWRAGLTDPDTFGGGASRLNLALDLRNSLTNNSATPTIVYTTDGERPDALKLYTYVDFDGAAWDREQADPSTRSADDGVLWPIEADWGVEENTRLDIAVQGLTERNLPLPTTPREVFAEGDWTYVSGLDEVIGDDINTRGLQYVVNTNLGYHDAAELRASDALVDTDLRPEGRDARYTTMPAQVDVERVQELAANVTAGADTRYDQALRIQTYLRSDENFTYDTTVNPSTSDAVGAFLDDRAGYCVQFATTMVMMLRSQGIPARMSVGFLPGTRRDAGQYVVTGSDAHAWPEVYFAEHGWVRFEPTPAVQTGLPPIWADPSPDTRPDPDEIEAGGEAGESPDTEVDPDVGGVGGTGGEEADAGGPPLVAIAVVVAALGAAAGVAVMFARRSVTARRRRHEGPEAAWERLRDQVGRATWSPTLTPFEARQHVTAAIEAAAGAPLEVEAAAALAGLTQSVSLFRYGPDGVVVAQAQLDEWVDAVVAEAEAAWTATDRPARAGGRTALRAGP